MARLPLDTLARAAERHIEKRAAWYLTILTTGYGLSVVLQAARKPFWYYELFTVYMCRLEGFDGIWSALKNGVDLNPPFMYGLVKLSQAALGEGHVGTRVPMMVGFWLMSLGLYLFLRRYTTVSLSLVGALFPAATNAFDYSFEARPYGIILGCAGIGLLCWQQAGVSGRSRFWLLGFSVILASGLLSHCYAVLLLFPFFLGEVARTLMNRRIDWPMWLSLGIAGLPVLLYPTLLEAGRPQFEVYPNFVPKLSAIPDFYRYLLYPAIPAITFTVLMGALLKGSANSNHEQGLHPNHRLPIPEIIVLAGFLIIPILAVLVARLYTGAYEGRYGLPAVVGLAGLFSLGASALWRRSAIMGPVLLLLFVAVLTEKNIVVAKNFLGRSAPPSADAHVLSYPLVGEDLLEIAIDRGQPIAINHFQPFLEFDYYASPKLASSMFLLTNPEAAGAYTGQSMFDSYAEGASMWFPIRGRIEKYSEFVGSHKRFLVYHKPWGTDWLVRKLLDDGARLELIKTAGLQGLYQVVFEEPPGTRAKQPPFAR